MSDATKALRGLAYGVTVGSRALPGQARTFGSWIGEAIGLVADIVDSGKDPAVEIPRIRTSSHYTAGPRARWAKRLEELRARAADPSDPLGDEDLADVYDDLETPGGPTERPTRGASATPTPTRSPSSAYDRSMSLRHVFLPATFNEPKGEELATLIDEREARWLELVEAGAGELEWVEEGGIWHSSPLRLNDPEIADNLAVCVTPSTIVALARALGVRLPTVDEAFNLLRNRPHVTATKVTFPAGHPLAYQTSASNEAIRLHSDALLEVDGFNANAGKWWCDPDGAGPLEADDDPVNFGWADPGAPYRWQGFPMWQTPGRAHNARHVDCSQTARFASSSRPGPRPRPEDLEDRIPDEGPIWRDRSLSVGLRMCGWLGAQFGMKVREIPGARHDPRILAYSRHCARGGRFLGVRDDGMPIWSDGAIRLRLYRDEDPWCAATASECLRVSLYPDEPPPHGLRVAVRELVEDAGGSLIPSRPGWSKAWRDIGYDPKPGDLAIYRRAGESPRRGGRGHVRTVIQRKGNRYLGIGGNEGNRVAMAWHPIANPRLEGWIAR